MDMSGTARTGALVAAGALAISMLAACGSSSSGSSPSSSSTASTASSSSASSSPSTSSSASGKVDVGVILPDTTSSPRWEGQDRPNLTKAFQAAGLKSDIENAGGDKSKFGNICDSMINEGVKVLMIVNLDSDSGTACEKKAGVKTIDYDRLTLGGGADYYVSFNNVEVGKLQGQGLVSCLSAEGKTTANIAIVDGASTDNNAALFKQGYLSVLDPKFSSGAYHKVGEQSGNWDATTAGTVYEQMYTQANGKIDGVLSANDTMAGGIIARMKAEGVAGKIPITGQDAGVEGLDNILAGDQCGTVYKNTSFEANAASKLAIDLIKGDSSAAAALVNGHTQDTVLHRSVPSVLETPVWVTASGVKKVITDGQEEASQVCAHSFAKLCKKYGVPTS
jgi:D-xylose transport system substrate-binding protein